jgi:hypothetical protein
MKALATLILFAAFLLVVSYTPNNQWLQVHAAEYSNTALLSWTPPTQNADGSTLTDLAGYVIYYGYAPRQYEYEVRIGSGLTSFMIEELEYGKRYYFTMTAVNSAGLESEYSNEVWKDIKQRPIVEPTRPKAPTGLVVAN